MSIADYFVHDSAICESDRIGDGSRIWAFAYILDGAVIGREANICSHTFIENGVVVGDRVTIKSGVQLWAGVTIEDDVFIGPNVTFTNDPFPRSKARPESFAKTLICKGASIGANATILPGLTIGANAMIAAGAVVTRSVPANALVKGRPSRISGYVGAQQIEPSSALAQPEEQVRDSAVAGVRSYTLPMHRDMRGSLVASEYGNDVPFTPKRSFLVFDVPTAEIRGEHVHRVCEQFMICVRGGCSVVVDDGERREEFRLDSPTLGLYIPPMVWATQFRHTPDAMLLVMASHAYDADDYIRSYEDFVKLSRQ